jgi:hypothetical protein
LVTNAAIVAILLFFGILLSLKIGKWIATQGAKEDTGEISFGAIDGAVFSLLSLFLAFSLSAAGLRLENRREMVVTEATSIREAYLYCSALPPPVGSALRKQLVDYVQLRQKYNLSLSTNVDIDTEYRRTLGAQRDLWNSTVQISRQPSYREEIRAVQASLMTTFRAAASRHVAAQTHEPELIYGLLISVALLAGLIAGRQLRDSQKNQLMHRIIFAMVISATLYVMMDLDNPRRGFIKLEYADHPLQDIK